uniref:AB hydrolase-1 domain-containing protein n=1 Tax=viral metagenome TaxID=1070528 RepID=A0A6C0C6Z9_9ZZZZ
MIQKLKEIGIEKSLIAINLGPTGNTSVIKDTETLHNLLEQIGRDKIILVGLSKGGLTVSNYVAKYGTKNISAVITISSPLGGTMLPDYFMPADHIARVELGYKSNFTQELKKNLPFYHIVPTWDHIIVPTDSASIDGPNHKSKIYVGLNGHLSIQDAPEVIQYVGDWIRKN